MLLPLTQPTIDLLGIAFLALILAWLAVAVAAITVRAIGLVALP